MPVPGAGESIYRPAGLNLLYPELNLQAYFRSSHIRCHNNGYPPCRRCERVGAQCQFLPSRKERALARRQKSQLALEPLVEGRSVGSDASEQSPTSNRTGQPFKAAIESIFEGGRRNVSSESADPVGHLESLYNPQLLSQAIDLFFQHFYPDLLFSLHEPTVRMAAQSGKLKPILAVAILALTVRFMPDLVECHGSVQEACDYFGNAIRAELLLETDKPSLDKIHALLFLSLHEWGSGRGARAVSGSSTALNMNLIY
jgi:hypothetical protein